MKNITRKSKKVKCGNSETIPLDLQSAIHAAVYSRVPKQVANHLGISTKRLLNYCSDKPFRFSSRHLLPLMQFTKNYEPLEFLAEQTGHFIFKVPLVDESCNPEKMLPLIFALKVKWEKLLQLFELYYSSNAEDRESLEPIAEALFSFINMAAQLRAAAFMKLEGSSGKKGALFV